MNIARTTLSSKILTHDKDHFAKLCVDAVLRLKVRRCRMYTDMGSSAYGYRVRSTRI
jgi:chaperonin GroEL (HSP60 family)